MAIHVGPVAAGYAGAATEAFVNELLLYAKGEKTLNVDSFDRSSCMIARETLKNGSLYALAGKGSSVLVKFKATKDMVVESLIKGVRISKVWGQSFMQGALIVGARVLPQSAQHYSSPCCLTA